MSDKSCRLVLITPPDAKPGGFESQLKEALEGGDCAALIIPAAGRGEADLSAFAKACIPVAQNHDCAVIIEGDARIAARIGADGFHLVAPDVEEEEIDLPGEDLICGAGGFRDRHSAMLLGTAGFDYLFFGDFNLAQADAPHPPAFEMASWWAEIFEIPAIIMCGNAIGEAAAAVAAGVEFIAFRDAVWSHPDGPRDAVRLANATIQGNIPKDD